MNMAKRLGLLLILASLIWLVAGSSALAVSSWLFRGKVFNADTGKPLEGVEMTLEHTELGTNYTMKTKKDGSFIRRLPLGQYHLILKKDGFMPQDDYVRHPMEGDALEKDYNMKPGEGILMSELTEEERQRLIEEREQIQQEIEEKKKKAGDLKKLFAEGLAAKEAGDLDTAIEMMTDALAIDAEQPNILGHLGDAHYQKGNYDKAIEYFQKAIALNPEDANFHTNLGNAYVKKGNTAQAKVEFEKAIQLDPTNADVNYFNMGAVLYNAGDAAGAVEPFQKCIQANPKNGPAHYYLAMCQVNTGDFKSAIDNMETYLKIEPKGQFAEQVKQILPALKQQVGN
jgi:tetratricopeptide (TPR) repeat protein